MFLAARRVQSGHWPYCTTISTSNARSRIVEVKTSFCTVSLTRSLLLCGSVHTKCASIRRTDLRPRSFFKQMARSSRLSSSAMTHVLGGFKYLSQFLQKLIVAVFGISSVISILFRKQFTHRFALLGSIGIPQSAHNTMRCGAGAWYSIVAKRFYRHRAHECHTSEKKNCLNFLERHLWRASRALRARPLLARVANPSPCELISPPQCGGIGQA